MVVKGVVCKKNVAHRRMTSKIERPRILILGGALEYQRVSNLLSSFDTLLQQVFIVSPFLYPFATHYFLVLDFIFYFFCFLFICVLHPYLGNGPSKDGSYKDRCPPS